MRNGVDLDWNSLIGRPTPNPPGALKVVSLDFRSGINLPLNDPNVVRMKVFLNYIVDWLNQTWPDNDAPSIPPDPPYKNHQQEALGAADFADDTGQTGLTFDSPDNAAPFCPYPNAPIPNAPDYNDPYHAHYADPTGDRTPGQDYGYPFFSNGITWLDNFDWRNIFVNPDNGPVFDNLTIVIAGPPWDDNAQTHYPDLREAVIPINQDWGIHTLGGKKLGSVTILFERIYNPYLISHEFGHVLGLVDLYDQRNGLVDARLQPLHGDNGVGNKSLMGDMIGLDIPGQGASRYSGDESYNAPLDSDYSKTSTANDLDCYSRYLCRWISPEKVHILNPTQQNLTYNLAPGNALLQVPIPLLNKEPIDSAGGHFFAIPLLSLWEQHNENWQWSSFFSALPDQFGFSYCDMGGYMPWFEWLLLEYRGPSSSATQWDDYLGWNSSSSPTGAPDKGLLIWHLDTRLAVSNGWGAALGIQSAYNDGAIPTYGQGPAAPPNYKFLRLLEADGTITAQDHQYVLAQNAGWVTNPNDPDKDARYGDKWDVWGGLTWDGSQDGSNQLHDLAPMTDTAYGDNSLVGYLSPYFDIDPWGYVNTNQNPPMNTENNGVTGLLVRNLRKSGANQVYRPPAILRFFVYPETSITHWPSPDDTTPGEMMFVDVFRLPGDENGRNLRGVNGVRIISLDNVSASQYPPPGPEVPNNSYVTFRVYAANSFDYHDTTSGKVQLYRKLHTDPPSQWHQNQTTSADMRTGHGTVTVSLFTTNLGGYYDIKVTFTNGANSSTPLDDGVDMLSNYGPGWTLHVL